jgi:3-deoxy-7-phosphoheptulonate synthase
MKEPYVRTGRLVSPEELSHSLPLPHSCKEIVEGGVSEISDILVGKSSKKLLVVGPCSVDFEDSVLEYADFLASLRDQVSDRICVAMRFYTAKPRTVGGWKGLQNSAPGKEGNLNAGLFQSRKFAIEILKRGLPLADEMLHPQFFLHSQDLYSYLAVGARSTENQYHREVASGAGMPIGMKNPTSGDVSILANSVRAAMSPSDYAIGDEILRSSGNPLAHAVLRGGTSGPNFGPDFLLAYVKIMEPFGNPSIVVDCNHANSRKDPMRQQAVIESVFSEGFPALRAIGKDPDSVVKGFMVESYLFDGNQNPSTPSPVHGKSLTDACIGKEGTERLVISLYDSLS